jgi:esterase/lipase
MARRRALSIGAPTGVSGEFGRNLLRSALVLVGILVVILGGASGLVTYRIVTARADTETVTPLTSFQSSYVNLSFTDRRGGEHDGWLLVGLKGAPVVFLCHGYISNRSDLLAMGNLLQQNHFNVYVFNFQGPKAKESYSDFGFRQSEDLMAAIDKVSKQAGVNSHRVGVFGINTGGYAAVVAAQQSPLIKAVVVDSIYDEPSQMFESQVDQLLGGSSNLFRALPKTVFRGLTWGNKQAPVRANLGKLDGIPKLFIQGRDSQLLSRETEAIYDVSPQPKRLLVLEHSYTALASGAVKKEYEDQVLTFFSQKLPLRAD